MTSRQRKKKVRAILAARGFEAIEKWSSKDHVSLRLLFSLTYDADPLIRCRAIEAIGKTASAVAAGDMEKVREFLRGLIWLMSDESGGIGWQAPEAVAEVCAQVPALHDEFAQLLPQFLQEESFVPSTCAALHRLAPLPRGLLGDYAPLLAALVEDGRRYHTYDSDTGKLVNTTIGQLAKKALEGS